MISYRGGDYLCVLSTEYLYIKHDRFVVIFTFYIRFDSKHGNHVSE